MWHTSTYNSLPSAPAGRFAFRAFWLFVFMVAWENTLVLPGGGTAAKAVGALVGVLGLFALVRMNQFRSHKLLLFSSALVLWSWVGVLWSAHRDVAASRALTYTQLLVVVWLTLQLVHSADQLASLMWAYVLGASVSAAACLLSFWRGIQFTFGRYTAEGFDPNDLSCYLDLAIVMALYLISRSTGIRRWTSLLVVPTASLAVLLTGSRTGAFGLAIALFLPLKATVVGLRKSRKVAVYVAAATAIGGAALIVPETTLGRILSAKSSLLDGQLNQRELIWRAALENLVPCLPLGCGAGNFKYVLAEQTAIEASPHNAFLAIAVEHGYLGLGLWVLILVTAFRRPVRQRTSDRAYWQALVGVLGVALVSLNFEWRKVTWLLMGLAAAGCKQRPKIVAYALGATGTS